MITNTQKNQVLQFVQSLKTHSFSFRDVVRALDLDSDERRSLQRYLDELDSEGVIHRIKRGLYALPAREKLISGVLSCHRDGYGFLIPDDRSTHKEDIFIPSRNMEDALHEDRVLVKVSRKRLQARRGFRGRRIANEDRKERSEGTVVRVLERKRPIIVGRYYAHPRFPFVVPLDARLFHDIRIPYQSSKGAENGQIVALEITLPPGRNQFPQGASGRFWDIRTIPELNTKSSSTNLACRSNSRAKQLRNPRSSRTAS